MPTKKTQHKRDAVAHVVALLGTDMFTTHEVWHTGQRMLKTGITWPRYLKRAFASIKTADQLGGILARHPAFGVEDGGNEGGRISMGSYGDRVRTRLWRVR